MKEEIWKSYRNYKISNFGNVKDSKGNIIDFKLRSGNIPKLSNRPISRIVYQLFIGDIPENFFVYRKDSDPQNNHVDNLVLFSRSEKTLFSKRPPIKISFEDFEKRAREKHGNKYKYDSSSFQRIDSKIKIFCETHGWFEQIGRDHCSGHGCWKCSSDSAKVWTKEQDLFLKENYKLHGVDYCANILKKSGSAVASRATYIGITKKIIRDYNDSVPTHLLSRPRSRAINKIGAKSEIDITKDFIEELFNKQNGKCALSGSEIIMSKNISENTASVDRINSDRGYTKDNIQLVHKDVNRMKNKYSDEYFYKVCMGVIANRNDLSTPETLWEEDCYLDTVVPRRIQRGIDGNEIKMSQLINSLEDERFSESALFNE